MSKIMQLNVQFKHKCVYLTAHEISITLYYRPDFKRVSHHFFKNIMALVYKFIWALSHYFLDFDYISSPFVTPDWNILLPILAVLSFPCFCLDLSWDITAKVACYSSCRPSWVGYQGRRMFPDVLPKLIMELRLSWAVLAEVGGSNGTSSSFSQQPCGQALGNMMS